METSPPGVSRSTETPPPQVPPPGLSRSTETPPPQVPPPGLSRSTETPPPGVSQSTETPPPEVPPSGVTPLRVIPLRAVPPPPVGVSRSTETPPLGVSQSTKAPPLGVQPPLGVSRSTETPPPGVQTFSKSSMKTTPLGVSRSMETRPVPPPLGVSRSTETPPLGAQTIPMSSRKTPPPGVSQSVDGCHYPLPKNKGADMKRGVNSARKDRINARKRPRPFAYPSQGDESYSQGGQYTYQHSWERELPTNAETFQKGILLGKRKNEPAHYMFKIESFSLLFEALPNGSKIESDIFEASGHKWRLDLYPNGYEVANYGNYISLYLVICDTENLSKGWEIYVHHNFFIYDHNSHTYATFVADDGNGARFNEKMTDSGFEKLVSVESFKNSENGYLCNDSCVFGVEVFEVTTVHAQNDRCLSLIKPPAPMNTYTWIIENFSAVTDKCLFSEVFKVGKVKWKLLLYPKGNSSGEGTHLSFYLCVHDADSLHAGWKIYVKCVLRVKNAYKHLHRKQEINTCLHNGAVQWGFPEFMPLSELNYPGKFYLVKDNLSVDAEISLLGAFKNFI